LRWRIKQTGASLRTVEGPRTRRRVLKGGEKTRERQKKKQDPVEEDGVKNKIEKGKNKYPMRHPKKTANQETSDV